MSEIKHVISFDDFIPGMLYGYNIKPLGSFFIFLEWLGPQKPDYDYGYNNHFSSFSSVRKCKILAIKRCKIIDFEIYSSAFGVISINSIKKE